MLTAFVSVLIKFTNIIVGGLIVSTEQLEMTAVVDPVHVVLLSRTEQLVCVIF